MKKLLADMDGADYYWDDILLHSPTWEEHIKTLTELQDRQTKSK